MSRTIFKDGRVTVTGVASTGRRPKNDANGQFFDLLTDRGITPRKRGWPDFYFISDSGDLVVVEVKTRETHSLKKNQHNVLSLLAKSGIRCYLWSPDMGFTQIFWDKPACLVSAKSVFA